MARPENEAKTELGRRLRAIRAAVGIEDRDAFADKTGISKSTIANYERGDRVPDAGMLERYRDAWDIDLNWLVTGDGTMFGRISLAKELENATLRAVSADLRRIGASGAPPDMIRLPVYSEVRASAGRGASAVSELADGVISFDNAFLRDKGATPKECVVIWARGDSMMPTIPDGSALVVDRSQTTIVNGVITVVSVGDDLLVKRVRRRMDGLIELISDNPAYAPETLGPDALAQLRIVGQLAALHGRFLMSINDVPEIRELFSWATVEPVATTYSVGNHDGRGSSRAELLISSPKD